MDFNFTDEQKLYKNTLERITREKIEPLLASYPEDRPLPMEACVKIRELIEPLGIQGCRVPMEYGGTGLGAVGLGIAAETIPYEAFELPMCMEVVAVRMAMGGSEKVKKEYLPKLLNCEKFAGSGTSEPNVGSDPRGVQTRAVLKGDRYVLNGTKIWVSAGSAADYLMIVASLGRDEKGRNIITPFLVDVGESPVVVKDLNLLGIRQSHLCEIFLEDVSIPKENIFSEAEGHAHRVLTSTWLSQRPVIGLANIRVAQKAYEAAKKYSLERYQFGKPIASFQLVQNMLVEMLTLIDCSKLLCYRVLTLCDEGQWPAIESSMAKYYACEAGLRVTNLAVEIHGSFGITTEFPVEKYYRDARVLAFPDGTIEIQKLIVGREITGIRAFS
jgi:alkylation response protein AidB-like acyl-CoA dehydrogenase